MSHLAEKSRKIKNEKRPLDLAASRIVVISVHSEASLQRAKK